MSKKKPYTAVLAAARKRRDKVGQMRREGQPVPVIAARMGISRARVYQILSRDE